jgi:hypothetical protein
MDARLETWKSEAPSLHARLLANQQLRSRRSILNAVLTDFETKMKLDTPQPTGEVRLMRIA